MDMLKTVTFYIMGILLPVAAVIFFLAQSYVLLLAPKVIERETTRILSKYFDAAEGWAILNAIPETGLYARLPIVLRSGKVVWILWGKQARHAWGFDYAGAKSLRQRAKWLVEAISEVDDVSDIDIPATIKAMVTINASWGVSLMHVKLDEGVVTPILVEEYVEGVFGSGSSQLVQQYLDALQVALSYAAPDQVTEALATQLSLLDAAGIDVEIINDERYKVKKAQPRYVGKPLYLLLPTFGALE